MFCLTLDGALYKIAEVETAVVHSKAEIAAFQAMRSIVKGVACE